jgi:uncharacterized repeat protein (TIGR03803 family)
VGRSTCKRTACSPAVAFAGGGTLQIDGTTMPAATISGFGTVGTIDLTGVAFDPAGSAVLTSGNVLQISEGGETVALQLDPTQSFSGHSFALASDGHGGTTVVDPTTVPYFITTLASFNGTDGSTPYSGLIADSAGDLFGTTYAGGASGDGTVFELVKTSTGYASTPTTLASFNGSDGLNPDSALVADAAGDLFGVTQAGGAGGGGTVFEIAKTAGGYAATPTTLYSFYGNVPARALIVDGAGDLFGTTQLGGANGAGIVFEIAKTTGGYASVPNVLVSFNGTDGANPLSELIADSAGDLFGTTSAGGAYNDGIVFEIAKTGTGYASTPTVLVSFNGTDGSQPYSGLIADAAGDLFGTTFAGGAYGSTAYFNGTSGYGTVFELVNKGGGSYTLQTLVSFNGSDGANPWDSPLIVDSAGNLFGTTFFGGAFGLGASELGGASGDGTVFEIAKTAGGYASTPTTLSSFNGTDGLSPHDPLLFDAAGDLLGTASGGGASGDGTFFELIQAQTVGGPYSGGENTAIALDLSVSAGPGDQLTTTLSVSHGTITIPGPATLFAHVSNNETANVSLSGTAAQIDKALAMTRYQGSLDYFGPDTLSMTTTDAADNEQASATAAITVNDTTVPSVAAGGPYSGNENAAITLGGVTVGLSPTYGPFNGPTNGPIVSPGFYDPVQVVFSVMHGTLEGSVAGLTQTGGSITFLGDGGFGGNPAEFPNPSSLSYAGDANYYGSDTLSVTATDTADNQQATGSATINVADTATITESGVTGGFSGNENSAISLSAISVSDSNIGDASLVATLQVMDGTITVGTTIGGATVGGGGGTVTLTGTAAQIDASLKNTSYTGNSGFYGTDTLSVTSTDGDGRSSGTSTGAVTVADTTVPSEVVPATLSGNENTAISLSGVSVSVNPNTGDPLTTVLSVAHGTITAGGHTDTSVTLSGTATAINTTLSTASYTPNAGFYGNDVLSVTATDTADGNNTTQTAPITVKPGGFMSSVPDAAGYAILYEGTGGHNLSIANVTVNGNVGVGGTGVVQYSGPGTVNGHLDFSAANAGQNHNTNGKNVGPTAVDYNAAAVTSALNEVNSLSTTLGKEQGTNIAISGNLTINASAGVLDSDGNYVFNVTSYNEGNGNVVTVNGDRLGGSVVFNFGLNSNVNLGGDVTLTGGLSDDQVLWNFTTSGKNINLNNNESSYPLPLAFHGVILAPGDNLSMVSANLDGRLWGGGSGDMQLNGGDTLTQSNQAQSAALLMQYAAAGFGGGSGQGAPSIDNATTLPPPTESPFITIPHH